MNVRDINPEWTDSTIVSLIDTWAKVNPKAGGSLLSYLSDVADDEEELDEEELAYQKELDEEE